jgi:hypothetical protein
MAVMLDDDDLEAMIASRRKSRKENRLVLSKCGKPVMVSDRFCPPVGKR